MVGLHCLSYQLLNHACSHPPPLLLPRFTPAPSPLMTSLLLPLPLCCHVQLSVLRLFHQLLSDPALRKVPSNKEALLLATKVVRGLFAKLAPPAATAAAAAAGQQQQKEEEEGGEEEGEEGVGGSKAAAAAEREGRRRAAVAGMLCVELLFWKHPHTCDQINREYSLREDDR